MSESVRVQLAPGWRPMTADELPEGLLRGTEDTVRYIAAAVPGTLCCLLTSETTCLGGTPGAGLWSWRRGWCRRDEA